MTTGLNRCVTHNDLCLWLMFSRSLLGFVRTQVLISRLRLNNRFDMTSSIDVAIWLFWHFWPLDGITVTLYYIGRPIEGTAHPTGGLHNSAIKNSWEKIPPSIFPMGDFFRDMGFFLSHSPPRRWVFLPLSRHSLGNFLLYAACNVSNY